MRKIVCLLCLLVAATGCKKEWFLSEYAQISLSPSGEIVLPASSGSFTTEPVAVYVTVTPEEYWEAESDQRWCSVRKHFDFDHVLISASNNPLPEPREATVTVSVYGNSVSFKVRQEASPSIGITPSAEQNFPWRGGEVDVQVKCEGAWSASTNSSLVSVDPQEGTSDGSVRIRVAENPLREQRRAYVFFKAGGLSNTLNVSIEPNPNGVYINTSPSGTKKLPSKGGNFTVAISTNTDWTASSDKSWVMVSTDSGWGNGSTQVTVAANTNNSNEAASLYFKAGAARRTLRIEREYTAPDPTPTPKYKYVREGYSTKVVYNIDGKYIREGYSTKVVYNIDGKYIREGYSTKVIYNIDGKYIREGYSTNVVYNIDGKYIREGYSTKVVYNLD